MSKELKQFYSELWAWVQEGCRQHTVFSTDTGLCTTLRRWSDFNEELHNNRNEELYNEQKALLINQCGTSTYPFNMCARYYEEDCACNTIYDNSKRLSFIEGHAK